MINSSQIKVGSYNPLSDNPVLWVDPNFSAVQGSVLEPFRSTVYNTSNIVKIVRNRVTMCPFVKTSINQPLLSTIGLSESFQCNSLTSAYGYEQAVVEAGKNQRDFTIFTVISGATDAVRVYFGWGDTDQPFNNSKMFMTTTTGLGKLRYFSQNSAGTSTSLEDTTDVGSSSQIVMWRSTSNTIELKVGNVARSFLSGTTGATGTIIPNSYTLAVWSGAGGGSNWAGDIGDHIVYPYSMTLQQIQRVYTYLSLKYGIA